MTVSPTARRERHDEPVQRARHELHGRERGTCPVDRLCIPAIKANDGPQGYRTLFQLQSLWRIPTAAVRLPHPGWDTATRPRPGRGGHDDGGDLGPGDGSELVPGHGQGDPSWQRQMQSMMQRMMQSMMQRSKGKRCSPARA